MNYKKISFLLTFFIIFSQTETKTQSPILIIQRLKAHLTAFFEKNIQKPVIHSYYVTKAAAELLFQEYGTKNWNRLDAKTKELIIATMFLVTYYGIHILYYPNRIAHENKKIPLIGQIMGGITTGTAGILATLLTVIISTKLNIVVNSDTCRRTLMLSPY
jgi:hypothetical protein